MTINGNNFNTSIKKVFFGDQSVEILNYTSTQIVVKTPSLTPGLYDLIIPSGEIGNAKYNYFSKCFSTFDLVFVFCYRFYLFIFSRSLSNIEYKLYISYFTPNYGSIGGRTIVNVFGDGFKYISVVVFLAISEI